MTPIQATPEASTTRPIGGPPTGEGPLSQLARREIHATLQAESAEALAAYEAAKDLARRKVLDRFQIKAEQLERIEEEADREGWPRWDGLADDRGPIPTFGPAVLDKKGRLVMSQEEHEARSLAARRMLAVIGKITGENDGDDVWDAFDLAMKESD